MAPPTNLDKTGRDFIREHEGEVLHAYIGPAGNDVTFGVGHLLRIISKGSPIPRDIALLYGTKAKPRPKILMRPLSSRFLRKDLAKHVEAVLRHVPERWRDTPGRLTVFTSLSFNLGTGILTLEPPLTTLGQALQGERTPETRERIADAILLYDKAGNPPKPLPGLTRRRRDERELFLKSWK